VRTQVHTHLHATADAFIVRARLQAWEGEVPCFEREWDLRIPRDQV